MVKERLDVREERVRGEGGAGSRLERRDSFFCY
jgi:hypothetical protein